MKKFKITGCVISWDYCGEGDFSDYIIAYVDLGIREFEKYKDAREWFEGNYPSLILGGSIEEV